MITPVEISLPIAGLVDMEAERERMEKELADAEAQIERLEKLLASPFARKSPCRLWKMNVPESGDIQRLLNGLEVQLG